ncbi:MAG: nitrate reductase molybdenum cofactor assembly chaperone [Actinomycetota bacterium]|nr:nitrate reductase molybdenum cofactor assembly chaperone [Actinomycetota bacterium]
MPGVTERTVVLKVASVLLGYPDAALLAERHQLAAAVDHLPRTPARDGLRRCLSWLDETDPTVAAAHYVNVFDLQRRCCLYLTYYTHGDTRKRGMALLALKDRYRTAGVNLESVELPDYLPIMLEFAVIAPTDGDAMLAEHRQSLELLRTALGDTNSPYAALLDAVAAVLPGPTRSDLEAVRRLIKDGPPHEDVGLEPFAPPEFLTGANLPTAVSLSGTRREGRP